MRGIELTDRLCEVRDAVYDGKASVLHPLIAPGPTQSGKSFAGLWTLFTWAARYWSGYEFGLFCRSQLQMDSVLKKHAKAWAAHTGLGWERQEDHYLMGSAHGHMANKWYTALGVDKNSEGRVRGMTLAGSWTDEATLLPESFITTVMDRHSTPGAVPMFGMNPDGPLHHIKVKWIDSEQGVHIPFGLWDNPEMTEEYEKALDVRYGVGTPIWRRMAKGEWAATQGAIFPLFHRAIGDPPDLSLATAFHLAFDHADASVTHCILVAVFPGNVRWVVGEWVYDGRIQQPLSATHQAERIRRDLARNLHISRIIGDPAAFRMRQAMSEEFRIRCLKGQNAFTPGVQKVNAVLNGDQLKVSRQCPQTIRSMSNHRWNEEQAEQGNDVPINKDKHGADAVRYYVWHESAVVQPVRAYGTRRQRNMGHHPLRR